MTVSSKEIKATARGIISARMVQSVLCVVIYLSVCFIGGLIQTFIHYIFGDTVSQVFLWLYIIFLASPMFLGLLRYFWRMTFDSDDLPSSVFYYFSDKSLYHKAMKLVKVLAFKGIKIALLVFIPIFILWLITNTYIYDLFKVSIPVWTTNLNSIYNLVYSFSCILFITLFSKYYLAPILFIGDENIDPLEAMNMAKIIANKSYVDFIFLTFSFLGIILISFFVLPIIFTLPYLLVSYILHSFHAIADYNQYIKTKNDMNFGFNVLEV